MLLLCSQIPDISEIIKAKLESIGFKNFAVVSGLFWSLKPFLMLYHSDAISNVFS